MNQELVPKTDFLHPESRSKILKPSDNRAVFSAHSKYKQTLPSYKKLQAYTPLLLDTDKLKIALQARKIPGAFEAQKRQFLALYCSEKKLTEKSNTTYV